MPRVICILAALCLLAACNGSGASTPSTQPSLPRAATASPRATNGSAGPSAAGSLQVSGGLSGFLSVLAVSCSPPGRPALVVIKGRIENKLFDVDIQAPGAGGFQIGASTASVQMSSQTPDDRSVNRWGAGQAQPRGGGAITIADSGGTIDADLQGVAGTAGTVHLRGGWSCPAT